MKGPYEQQAFSVGEIQRAINTLTEVFNELEFTKGSRGMVFIMMFIIFQHRASGHNMELLFEQLKGIWATFDQMDKRMGDDDLSKDN